MILGKCNRGLMVPVCLEYLRGGHLTEEEESKAIKLGWCVEIVSMRFVACKKYLIRFSAVVLSGLRVEKGATLTADEKNM